MGKQVEDYITTQADMNLSRVFDQYLRTTTVPTFEYRMGNPSDFRADDNVYVVPKAVDATSRP